MPVLPLFQTPPIPDAWHRVTAPAGTSGGTSTERTRRAFPVRRDLVRGLPPPPGLPAALSPLPPRARRVTGRPCRANSPACTSRCTKRGGCSRGSCRSTRRSVLRVRGSSGRADRAERVRAGCRRYAAPASRGIAVRGQVAGAASARGSTIDGRIRVPSQASHARTRGESHDSRVPRHRPPLDRCRPTVRRERSCAATRGRSSQQRIARPDDRVCRVRVSRSLSLAQPPRRGSRQWVGGRVLSAGSLLAFQVTRPCGSTSVDEDSSRRGGRDRRAARTRRKAGSTGVVQPCSPPPTPKGWSSASRLRLSNPRVIDGTRGYARIAYEAQFSGRTGTAFCNVIQARRLVRPVLAGWGKAVRGEVESRPMAGRGRRTSRDPGRREAGEHPFLSSFRISCFGLRASREAGRRLTSPAWSPGSGWGRGGRACRCRGPRLPCRPGHACGRSRGCTRLPSGPKRMVIGRRVWSWSSPCRLAGPPWVLRMKSVTRRGGRRPRSITLYPTGPTLMPPVANGAGPRRGATSALPKYWRNGPPDGTNSIPAAPDCEGNTPPTR